MNLTRIYTRTGDDGTTALGDFSRVAKTDSRLAAYADVDEANCAIGVAVATGGLPDEIATVLLTVQNDLFDTGADLCTPVGDDAQVPALRVTQDYVDWLEQQCDRFNADLEPLRSFVLPGGTPAAARLHVARTIVRRAERLGWTALAEHGEAMNMLAVTYLNRLSDLLFILARAVNAAAGHPDVLWEKGRRQQP